MTSLYEGRPKWQNVTGGGGQKGRKAWVIFEHRKNISWTFFLGIYLEKKKNVDLFFWEKIVNLFFQGIRLEKNSWTFFLGKIWIKEKKW